MQNKVSKQSILTIVFAILMAIFMATTATFAAFSDSKTATGTVTFQGNVITTIELGSTNNVVTAISAFSSGSATITISNINTSAKGTTLATELAAIKVGLTSASTGAKFSVLVGVNGTAAAAISFTPKGTGPSGFTATGSLWKGELATNTTKTLGDFYTIAFNAGSIPSGEASSTANITIKVGADTITAPELS